MTEHRRKASIRAACLSGLFALIVLALPAVSSATLAPPQFSMTHWPNAFVAKGGANALQYKSGRSVTCGSETESGEFFSFTQLKTSADLKECGLVIPLFGRVACQGGAGAGKEEIRTNQLSQRLVFTNEATAAVGVLTSSWSGGPIAEFTCGGAAMALKGTSLSSPTPVSVVTNTLVFKASQSGGVPAQTRYFEAGTEKQAKLELGGEEVARESTETWTFAYPLEIHP
jgi:hypothetical protein